MTDKYAVVGNPVEHSLSPRIHQKFAEQTGEKMEYGRILAHQASFVTSVQQFFDAGGCGLNITLPFKESAAKWVEKVSTEALVAGAVNTIARSAGKSSGGTIEPAQDRLFTGYNTDGSGLLHDLTHNITLNLTGMKTLILGAGGASRGIVAPLLQAGAIVVLANRTVDRAHRLAQDITRQLQQKDSGLSVLPLEDSSSQYDLVINATSANAMGDTLHLPKVCQGAFCYDLFYQLEGNTGFCDLALQQGAQEISNGLGMLVEQAAEAFLIWRGIRPDSASVIKTLRAPVRIK